MKKILFLIIAASPFLAKAQTGSYDVKGSVGQLDKPAKAYLKRIVKGKISIDSVALTAGNFDFKGALAGPEQALLLLDHTGEGADKAGPGADVLKLYLENGVIQLTANDSLSKAKITGSKLNNENASLALAIKPVMTKAEALNIDYQKATEADRPTFVEKFKDLQNEQKLLLRKFIQQHAQSFVSLDALRAFAGPSPDYSEVMPLYTTLSPTVQNTENGRNFKQALDKLKTISVGAMAPEFTQNDSLGKPVSLSSFKGKYVLIDFWASWCGPCRQENPNVVKAYDQYKAKNFTVLGVSLDRPDGKQAWLQAIKDDGLTWNQVSDLKFWNNEVATLYGVSSIPGNFLIDPDGKIIAKDLRGEELEQTLEKLLK